MSDPTAVTDPAVVVDPTVVNGQCEQADFQQQQQPQQQPSSESQGEGLKMDQEMKITDSIEDGGLLESSMRLKPHEAQSYRKKALWVSWVSIMVTIVLAIAAFNVTGRKEGGYREMIDPKCVCVKSLMRCWSSVPTDTHPAFLGAN